MIRVAILSAPGAELSSIRDILVSHGGIQATPYCSLEETQLHLRSFDPSVIVLHWTKFDRTRAERVRQIRTRFPRVALIVCASEIDDGSRFLCAGESRFALLSLNDELEDLPELIERLERGDPPLPRMHPRSRRAEKVEISDANGRSLPGRFIDFGKMGAKLQLAATGLRPNDRVLLSYESSTPGKTRRIEAVVVWEAGAPGLASRVVGARNVGVKFIAYL